MYYAVIRCVVSDALDVKGSDGDLQLNTGDYRMDLETVESTAWCRR